MARGKPGANSSTREAGGVSTATMPALSPGVTSKVLRRTQPALFMEAKT